MTDRLVITRPDDMHLHLRDGVEMQDVIGFTTKRFGRAIIMPNLKLPVTTSIAAMAYRDRILKSLYTEGGFRPLMTLYLTDSTSAAEISRARSSGHIAGVKLYPAGATTHSDSGVTDILKCTPALEKWRSSDCRCLCMAKR